MRLSLMLVAVMGLVGCASSSGIFPTGGDTYMTAATASPARGGIAGAVTIAYRHAETECMHQGRQMQVISEETGHDFPAAGRDVLHFRCAPIQ